MNGYEQCLNRQGQETWHRVEKVIGRFASEYEGASADVNALKDALFDYLSLRYPVRSPTDVEGGQ